jgi:hypothetical protein
MRIQAGGPGMASPCPCTPSYEGGFRMSDAYTYRRSGTCGCEIIDPNGAVIAWTVDVSWAGICIGLLNGMFKNINEPVLIKDDNKDIIQTYYTE